MQTLTLNRKLTDKQTKKLHKTFLTDDHFDTLITADTDAFDANGNMLFRFRKNVIPFELLKLGYDSFKKAAQLTNGRGAASGAVGYRKFSGTGNTIRDFKIGQPTSIKVGNFVESGNVGFMDRNAMIPYCRKTAFAKKYFEQFEQGIPFIKCVDSLYQQLCPVHYSKQLAIANATNRNYVIDDTSFTTVTVNKNFQTAVHRDMGDYPEGFGNLCVYREGSYEGCYFCLPAFRVAIDMQNCDMLFVNVHEWHGNTPFKNTSNDYLRISFVMYYREYMIECKQPNEELLNVKNNTGGFYKI